MIKYTGLILASALVAMPLLGDVHAQVAGVSQCQAEIEALKTKTLATEFFGRNGDKDEAALVSKLDDAWEKLDRAKLSDAVRKVQDYIDKVQALASQGKIATDPASDPNADLLIMDAQEIITCIQGI
jgi:hypothetical protein